ncbi:MAG TPA: sigma 54-interacting transcriptional regulator [Gammaproteobacteria bacterium]|jgi:PAS domain S-box-containing protein|nr:sigma 54-interacting transcriptional regulator [Gammaproteobacteria bacterium]
MSIEASYQWLFRRSPALIVLLNEEGFFVDASDSWLRRFGYGREEITNMRPQDLATKEVAKVITEEYLPMLRRTGRLQGVPVDLVTRSGERVDCLATAIVDRTDEGAYLRTVAVYTELGQQARLEQHYRGLYRATPAMLHTVDSHGRIIHVSDRWLQTLGYRREEVLGRPIMDFMGPETRLTLGGGKLEDVIAHGELENVPRSYVAKSGEVLEVVVSATADRDPSGAVVALLVASTDVTERNRAERQLRAAFEENARLRAELERERDYLREEVQVSMNYGRIIGESPPLKKMLARIEAVAQTSASVLIQGESGVGKELVAHVIHARSPRSQGPLVKVNCASIPHELFESEFFGHVKGAFTGAHRDRVGRFELADGGTIFLDEVGEIPLDLQSKLLRVLQESEYERVGDDRTHSVDVRVIAATNRDLEQAVAEGKFREDLFYRLSVFPIEVPPLRERGDDVLQIASHFLERTCQEFGHRPLTLSKQQAALLKRYDWPGNIRELKNVIERAVILSRGKVLRLDLAMSDILNPVAADAPNAPEGVVRLMTEAELLELERRNTLLALERSEWRVSGPNGAAKLLGVKPTTLADRMKKLKLRKPSAPLGRNTLDRQQPA